MVGKHTLNNQIYYGNATLSDASSWMVSSLNLTAATPQQQYVASLYSSTGPSPP
jgi:beta-lactamase class D